MQLNDIHNHLILNGYLSISRFRDGLFADKPDGPSDAPPAKLGVIRRFFAFARVKIQFACVNRSVYFAALNFADAAFREKHRPAPLQPKAVI